PKLIKWVQDTAKDSQYVMSVCTGAFILAKAGLLDGLSATTVSHAIDQLATAGKNINAVHDQRYVDNGKIITTAALSSGIDGALHLVSKMLGKGQAQMTALGIEYNWDADSKFVRAAFADRYLPNFQGFDARLLSVGGNSDHWELKALISKPASVAEIVELARSQIASATPHAGSAVVVSAAKSIGADKAEIEWKFSDEKGRGWVGSQVT